MVDAALTFALNCQGWSAKHPAHSMHKLIMNGCDVGLAAMAGYEVFHVLPKWRFLVTKPMQTSGTTAGQATFWLAAFGAVYNCHRFTTGGHCSIQGSALTMPLWCNDAFSTVNSQLSWKLH